MKERRPWTNEEDKLLVELYKTKKQNEISEILNRPQGSISGRAKLLCIRKPKLEFAVYKGEDILAIGTKEECAERLGVSPETIYFYSTESYRKRVEKRNHLKPSTIAIAMEVEAD